MRHYLVVADRTLVGPHLLGWLADRAAEDACAVHLVVPVTPSGSLTWTESEVAAEARRRLDEGLAAVGALGIPVTGEVGDGRPVAAVLDVLNRDDVEVDEVVLSTLHRGVSRWLRMDVPRRMAQAVPVPVTHLVAPANVDTPA